VDIGDPEVSLVALPEGHDPGPRLCRPGQQDRRRRDIGIHDCRPARPQSLEDRGLLPRDPLDTVEGFQMGGGNSGDDGHVQLRQPCQRRNLSGVVHPDLDHREFGLGRHPRQRERHAPVVVVAGFGRMGAPLPRQHGAQHVLGRGLADRSGHTDKTRPGARPGRHGKRGQRLQHIRHDQQRGVCGHAVGPVGDKRRRRPLGQRLRHELMPVAHVLQRHEQIARLQRARVDRHTACRPGSGGGAAGGLGGLGCGPERCHISPSSAATATLACSTSSKG
jgi:hypothetical protein